LPIKNDLTGKEICDIIKSCGESGVSEFNFGGLRISFPARNDVCQDTSHTQSPRQVTAISSMFDENSFIQQDEADAKDEELAEMKLQDPLQYETLLAQQEFE